MRYFMYSPIDMSEHEAFELVKGILEENVVIEVRRNRTLRESYITPGERPQAHPNTYLVRVEHDDSLRIVDRNLD